MNDERRRRVAGLVVAISSWGVLGPSSAEAQALPARYAADLYPRSSPRTSPIGHAAYGLGFASGPRESTRSVLDVAGGVWFADEISTGTMFSKLEGWFVHGTLTAGFKASPNYMGLGGGYAMSNGPGVAGSSFSAGPVARVGSTPAFGGELRGSFTVLLLELGVSAEVVHGSDGTDVPLFVTVGLGFD